MKNGVSLVLGGTRSGKTHRAESLALSTNRELVYVASCHPNDDEMKARVLRHKTQRSERFKTIEGCSDLDLRWCFSYLEE